MRYFKNLDRLDISGNVDDDLSFEYGEGTDADRGCGATLMGEMWYFGGFRNTRQVSLYYDSYGPKIKHFAGEKYFF